MTMAEVQLFPPSPDVLSRMLAIPQLHVAPTMLVTQQGPDGHLGPDAAEAILVLQATFTDPEGAAAFWDAAAELMQLLADAPGFIRRYSFPDGPSVTLIALWRTAADARAFAATPEHRAATRNLFKARWQQSHFAALWEMTSSHGRMIFCDQCDGITAAASTACSGCGAPLTDVYRTRADGGAQS
jgi:heme-degrading monooxygenase HmoA